MKKLSIAQMFALASASDIENLSQELDLSVKQLSNFKNAEEQNSPRYMAEFWEAFNSLKNPTLESVEKILKPVKVTKQDNRPLVGGKHAPGSQLWEQKTGKSFVFTSAQNNTEINKPFFDALQQYCKRNKAELIVGGFVYNKNGFQNGQLDDDEIYFASEIKPFINDNHLRIGDNIVWLGGFNVLPTAKYPLSGLEQYTDHKDCILPHAKIALESVATLKNQPAKMMYSTGTVTLNNYIQKKAGQLAESSHCYGALIVEQDIGGVWHCRHIQADDTGGFYDLDSYYHPAGFDRNQNCMAITLGDIHAEKSDFEILNASIEFCDSLQPDFVFLHDLHDFTSLNHHNRENGFFLFEKHLEGASVESDLETTRDVLNMLRGDWETIVVESNHDLALNSWTLDSRYDWRKDTKNSETWLRLQTAKYDNVHNKDFNLLEFALFDGEKQEGITFLKTDDSFIVCAIEQAIHGHTGANGSKGSPKQFQKLNIPVTTGHTHTASIFGNVYTVGVTGNLNMEYNKGASSWSHTHCITYPNGMRALITLKKSDDGIVSYRA